MKLSDVKHDIDAYFDAVSASDIVKQLEALGYEFQDVVDEPFSTGYDAPSVKYIAVESNKIEIALPTSIQYCDEDSFSTNISNANATYTVAA